jgi:hypothetical protein
MMHSVHHFVMPARVADIHVTAPRSEASVGLPFLPRGWPEQSPAMTIKE